MEEVEQGYAGTLVDLTSDLAEKLVNYVTLEETKSVYRYRYCLVALNRVEKAFFFNIRPEQINSHVIKALDSWRERLIDEDRLFQFLLRKLILNVNVVINLTRFNQLLIGFIDRVKQGTHLAFQNHGSFLEDLSEIEKELQVNKISLDIELKEQSFHGYQLFDSKRKHSYPRIKTSLSPLKLISGFSNDDKLNIHPVESFVYSCFEFHSQYEAPEFVQGFSIAPKFKHSLTVLLFEMKQKKWIQSTNDEIFDLIIELIPGSSRSSLKKYSSPSKKILSKHKVDIQLFS